MYISLGSDCASKKRMDEYIFKENKQITHAFDWVLSDFNAICYLLEQGIEDKDMFNTNKLSIITKTYDNKYAIKHNDCYFISLHDASCDLSEEDALKLVCEKYNRRLVRFLEYIKNPEHDIVFVGLYDNYNPIQNGNMKIHDKDVLRFYKILNQIAPFNTHKLVLITSDTKNLQNSIKYSKRVQVLDSKNFINMKDYIADWYRFFLDWQEIFDSIIFKNIL